MIATRRANPPATARGDRPDLPLRQALFASVDNSKSAPWLARIMSTWPLRAPTAPQRGWRPSGLAEGEWPWLLGAILFGGVLGPLALMFGLTRASGSTASLLLNLEAVLTAVMRRVMQSNRWSRQDSMR